MSKQIAVRLPDDMVKFIDGEVRQHRSTSRAAFVLAALEREQRRLIAARDAALLSRQTSDPDDLDNLAAYAAGLDTGLN